MDEYDLRLHAGSCGSGATRMVRRRLLSMIPLVSVGLGWSRLASAQLRIDCGVANEPDAPVPYRDLRRDVECERLINPISGTDSTGMRLVAIEYFFAYDCATCYTLEAELADWQRTLPSNARLVRVPATYSALGRLHAQAFYTATRLGKIDQLHTALYEAVQRNGQRLDSIPALATLFENSGVDSEAFASEFNSVEVYVSVSRAERQNRQYGVTNVPALVIGGRYFTTSEIAGSQRAMLAAAVERTASMTQRR